MLKFFYDNVTPPILESVSSNPNLKEEKARQKCDIYSFSIISHEVIFEQGPYWTGPYSSGKFSNGSFQTDL